MSPLKNDLFDSLMICNKSQITAALLYIRGGTAEWQANAIQEAAQQPNSMGGYREYGTWEVFQSAFLDLFEIEDKLNLAMTKLTTLWYEDYNLKTITEFNSKMTQLFVITSIVHDNAQITFYHSKLPGNIRDKIVLSYPQWEPWKTGPLEQSNLIELGDLTEKSTSLKEEFNADRQLEKSNKLNPVIWVVTTNKLDQKERQCLMQENQLPRSWS